MSTAKESTCKEFLLAPGEVIAILAVPVLKEVAMRYQGEDKPMPDRVRSALERRPPEELLPQFVLRGDVWLLGHAHVELPVVVPSQGLPFLFR